VRPRIRNVGLAQALLLGILALALTAHSAAASVAWCRSDPILLVDGKLADVFVSIPLDALLDVTGATEFVITTPRNVSVDLAVAGIGFGYGELVSFEQSKKLKVTPAGIELLIEVYLPASEDHPVAVEFAPHLVGILWPTRAEGVTNSTITLRAVL
jgi:hypothetical protein